MCVNTAVVAVWAGKCQESYVHIRQIASVAIAIGVTSFFFLVFLLLHKKTGL